MPTRILLLFFTLTTAFGQPEPPTAVPSDEQIFSEKLKSAYTKTAFPERVLAAAQAFLGTPYGYGTLDQNAEEQVVINLRALDCWTFVEVAVALAQTAEANRGDFDFFKEKIRELRYHDGVVDGYGSRIHYFSGWILQQQQRGILDDLTHELGGIKYTKSVNYITAHVADYPQIAHEKQRRALEKAERSLAEHEWFFIPKNKVAAVEKLLQPGDVIATTSSRNDLDISHQGFAVRKNGRIHLLHASSDAHKVVVSRKPLPDYLAKNRTQSGIMVCRFKMKN